MKLEQLERRQLLSAALDGSTLRILTGGAADSIFLSVDGSDLKVEENGVTSRFALASVGKIHLETGAGNDLVQAADIALPMEALLGAGSDTLLSGGGNDTVYGGSGSDLISTGAGNDVIYGETGDDRIMAGAGNDTVTGGSGNDAINSGDGTDTVYDSGKNVDRAKGNVYEPLMRGVSYQPEAYLSNVTGYDPNQIRKAYGFGDIDLTAGAGQTIYIVDAYTGLNIWQDFTTFCQQFDLPVPTAENFQIVNASGKKAAPAVDSNWAGEIMLDLEWARAIAPGAKIVLVQADSNISVDLYRAVKKAADMAGKNGGGVVSMSFGRNYIYDPGVADYDPTTTADMYLWDNLFRSKTRVTFLAASGDDGAAAVASWPAMSPYVTAVGGTSLSIDQDGNRIGEEAAWFNGGSGYGLPDWYERPTYQDGIPYYLPIPDYDPDMTDIDSDYDVRALPDVSYNADPATPYAFYTSTPVNGDRGWFTTGGTSAGTPQWAALVAIANQRRREAGLPVIGNRLNGMVYDIYNGFAGENNPNGEYENSFNDIIVGQAGPWLAAPRFDMATGVGTPKANALLDTMSSYTGFMLQKSFTFEARLYMPFSVAQAGRLPVSSGQLHTGTGSIVGSDQLNVIFITDPVARIGDGFSSVPVSDVYYDVEEGQASAFRVQLARTGRGQTSGRIYGIGTADIENADTTVPFGIATFTLKFNGRWWTGKDGQIHFHVEFNAVDPVTYEPLESRPGSLVYDPSLPWFGAFYSGEMNG